MILTITPNPMLVKMMIIARFRPGAQIRPSSVLTLGGGKGIHVTRVARCLGADSLAVGFAAGNIGSALIESLREEGLPFHPVETGGETRIGVCLLGEDLQPILEVPEPGPELGAADGERLLAAIEAHLSQASLVVCSGSLPEGLDPAYYGRVVAAARALGKRCIVDTHGEALRQVLASRPYAIKPNWEELAELAGRAPPERLEELPKFLETLFFRAEPGPEHVVLSLGARGVLLADRRAAWHVWYDGSVKGNPIGSGDALVAGIAVGLARSRSLVEAVRLGVACATANLQYVWPGFCTPADLERYSPLVKVRAMPKGR